MYYPSNGSHEQVLHVQHLHGIHTYGSSSTASKRDQARGRSGNVSVKILTGHDDGSNETISGDDGQHSRQENGWAAAQESRRPV